ncbi:hypothetical protein [Ferruginibacter sp. SUN106]|uniref:hypothetical protein n=1 Tax=Ferruginibacter sp. SUN106 TaxID=2978348 RepID=UPI003D36579B
MRFLSVLLLSLCCLAASLQSNAIDIPIKQQQAPTEYRAVEQAVPDDALNDYYQVAATAHVAAHHSVSKEVSGFFTGNTAKNIRAYIPNDSFQNSRIHSSGNYAKTFRIKLIFPQHYHW